ncbi:hypothetical protein [Streptomyces sp. NPDC059564]|uniref:hypothetical protein n=1 Tax=Streptomyces sp. NPDC059564 TaxID=3346865 RepID=UPI00368062BA
MSEQYITTTAEDGTEITVATLEDGTEVTIERADTDGEMSSMQPPYGTSTAPCHPDRNPLPTGRPGSTANSAPGERGAVTRARS